MDHFEKKTHQTPRGYTYTYYIARPDPNNTSLPTLLFQHGWPDHAEMWCSVATLLHQQHHIPNPILIPDMLGYDGTSKPTSPSAYTHSGLTSDLISILDTEQIATVISIGHDWGSRLAQRLYNYHPSRVSGLILVNVGYSPPQRTPFSLSAVNAATTKTFGYPIFAYWDVFAAADGPSLLKTHVAKLFHALHAAGSDGMKRYFCDPGSIRTYLTSPDIPPCEVRPYARHDPNFKRDFVERMQRDGFEGPQNWYVSTKDNWQLECDQALPEERDTVRVPVLYTGATDDAVCRPEAMYPYKAQGLLPDLEEAGMIDASHWVPYEKPEELATFMADWLKRRFPA